MHTTQLKYCATCVCLLCALGDVEYNVKHEHYSGTIYMYMHTKQDGTFPVFCVCVCVCVCVDFVSTLLFEFSSRITARLMTKC